VNWAPSPEDDPLELEWRLAEQTLAAEELSRLLELRKVVAASGLDSHEACKDVPHSQRAATLLRYLRARSTIEQSLQMFKDAMDWRRDFHLEAKLLKWRQEWDAGTSNRVKLLRTYDYTKCVGLDHAGLPVYLHRTSQCDAAGLVRELGQEVFVLHHLLMLEGAFAAAQKQMLRTGKLITSFVEIYDQGDYGLVPNYLRRGYGAFPPYKEMVPILDKVYPERVRVTFICRCPGVFAVWWRLVAPLLPKATVKKIRIKGYRANTWLAEMEELLPEKTIPDFLRSDDRSLLGAAEPWGGIVPEGSLARMQQQ